jgi:hypothetical protein
VLLRAALVVVGAVAVAYGLFQFSRYVVIYDRDHVVTTRRRPTQNSSRVTARG